MAVETYIVVENGTPYEMELCTTVKNATDWEGETRPDKNLNMVELGKFSSLDRKEDLSDTATSAEFTVSVAIKYKKPKDDEGKEFEDVVDEISFSANQYEAKEKPDIPAPKEKWEIPDSRSVEVTGTASDSYVVFQSFLKAEDIDGKLAHIFSISERREVN